jgi:hypothetical protein
MEVVVQLVFFESFLRQPHVAGVVFDEKDVQEVYVGCIHDA